MGWNTDILDVCLARYNDKKWAKIDIKNWASCIPEVSPNHSSLQNLILIDIGITPNNVHDSYPIRQNH